MQFKSVLLKLFCIDVHLLGLVIIPVAYMLFKAPFSKLSTLLFTVKNESLKLLTPLNFVKYMKFI